MKVKFDFAFTMVPKHYSLMLIQNIKKYYTPVLFIISLAFSFSFNGCYLNKATGERQFNIVSESQEIQLGKESDQQITATMGIYQDPQLQQYVESIGKRMASTSERPNLPWTFRVIDDPVVNAFALPGGYIYITRGILSHLDNEAQLAGVIGHEIGHVTGKHSVTRISEAQIAQVGLGAAMILRPELQKYGQLASMGLGLLFLKFGRDDEKQADDLGLRYMQTINEDPRQMAEVMEMLSTVTKQSGGGGMPEWLSTHPNPENRKERILEQIKPETQNSANLVVNRDEYLEKIGGMTFGQDPREGYFKENSFFHPQMKFRYEFPKGWQTVNQKQAVLAVSPNQDAAIQITLSEKQSPSSAATALFSQEGISSTGTQNININGMQAVTGNFSANTEQGAVNGKAAFVGYEGNVFQIIGYSGQQQWSSYQQVVANSFNTFNRLDDPQALNVQPAKLEIITLDQPMTIEQFAQKYSPNIPLETILLINQVTNGAKLNAGQKLKRITGGNF